MRRLLLLSLSLFMLLTMAAQSSRPLSPKREFRGAWIQFINGQFQGMDRDAMQANLTRQLNSLQTAGVNAIMFQVRGEADAFYPSPYEPWSRFLTGTQGTPPSPYWDPLAWMVEECHKRGMELHAWINPFRAKTKGTRELAVTHPCVKMPGTFFEYDGLYILDPARPEVRSYICQVAADIVRRYDIDGLHIDDYFYPYPVAGKPIPDDASFRTYNNGLTDRGEWRRQNVNRFIYELHNTLRSVKPWVKFGVAPFGIYHNKRNGGMLPGSNTNGLQNYDDLYADVLYWINQGWVDYTVPQIYWEIGHPAADYDTLIRWWARYASKRPLFIGQDVERTVRARDAVNPATHQMPEKMRLQRSLPGVSGSCLWYSAAVVRNEGGYASALQQDYHRYPALQPGMPFIDDKAPKKPRKVKDLWMPDGLYLFWTAPKAKDEMDRARQYVVYRFDAGEKANFDDVRHIVTITSKTFIKLPYNDGQTKYDYYVTALDRLHNESKPEKEKVRL